MLRYGIPEYRLPKAWMDRELNHVWELGATFKPNMRLGRDFHVADLLARATTRSTSRSAATARTSWGSPARTPTAWSTPSRTSTTRTRGVPVPRLKGARVVVIGGGFTAIDCTRTSVRQQAAEVTLVYRRDLKDMPAQDEVHEAIEEGARVIFQAAPTRIVTDKRNKVTGVEFQRMKLGEPDEKGRRRPEPMPGTEFVVELRHRARRHRPGARSSSWVEHRAGGDPLASSRSAAAARSVARSTSSAPTSRRSSPRATCAPASTTVVEAIGEGRRACYAIDYWLRGHDLDDPQVRRIVTEPQPSFLTIVPFTDDVKEPQAVMGKQDAEERKRASTSTSSATPATRPWPRRRAACSAPARRSATATCARRRSSTRRRSTWRSTSARSRTTRTSASTTATAATRRIASSFATTPAASTAAAAPRSARRSSARAATTSSARASTRSSPPPTSCRSTRRRACRAAAARRPARSARSCRAPRVLETYQLDVSRCIFCGICADACPYDALRCGPEFEFSEYQRDLPMLDILEMSDRERPTR